MDENVVVKGRTVNSGTLIIGEKTFRTDTFDAAGGTIEVSTLRKGEDSETGKLVVTHEATGKGKVKVVVRDGSVGMDLNRLDVAVLGPNSTLKLDLEGTVTKDGKSYMLMKTDDSADGSAWYLTTTNRPQQFRPSPKPDPEDDGKPDHASGQTHAGEDENQDNHGGTGGSDIVWTTSTLKTPQAGARAGLAYLAAEVFDLSLRGHVGDRVYHDLLTGEERETSLWMLNMGNWSRFGDTTSQLGFDGRTNVTHLGGDIYKWNLNETDTLRIGLLGSYGEADYNTKSDVTWLEADAKFEGWSVGAYASWQTSAESGPFANGQIRWNHFENEVREERLEKDKYDSEGLSATFEAGWTQRLFTKKNSGGYNMAFDLEPRAHFYWMDFDADTGFDSTGQLFDTDGKDVARCSCEPQAHG
ncbi:autotransporter outer membrane beta-barrel domain-containing protein [Sutterella seckii]|uniref:Autotransporter outer membrane beta-barrel domain-containing protein n=1 Tax=Sutterella seckii TaxID=1944635 RepID=A0A6I1EQ91_9BURK|nr:autotransporter outer membrane beta-barrel domain-containing protein [Sutterella seckii]KAB7655056.1 autotransporter outer membrane beta-barrel domain-containing protein [Sutterella seckii]